MVSVPYAAAWLASSASRFVGPRPFANWMYSLRSPWARVPALTALSTPHCVPVAVVAPDRAGLIERSTPPQRMAA